MKKCGAKTRSGAPCRSFAMENGRCRMHGGKSTGAPKENKHAARPGALYSKYLTDEEKVISEQIELGQVDEELRLTRIRLIRAMKREGEFSNKYEKDQERREPVESNGQILPGVEKVTVTKKVRDYWALIDRLTARIESLERTRAELAKFAAPEDQPVTRIEVEVVGARADN